MTVRSKPPAISGPTSRSIHNGNNALHTLIAHVVERRFGYGLAFVLLVASLGILLTVQGWRSRTPAHDLVPHIHNVRNLVEAGAIPIHGDTGSYGSYKPPGTAWLMLPSTLIFADPRLSEYVGTAFLHLATLLGIFLLAYRFFGVICACLAAVLYGLSSAGIFLAGSLWPNGRPDFYIWFVLFASQWVIRKDARYLAAATAVWALGMYVDMAILPAIFILAALWLYYRPPVRLIPLSLTAALVLVAWFPYLRFETGRNFADIRSQVLFQNIFPPNYRDTWCNPNITLQEWGNAAEPLAMSVQQPQPYQGPNLAHSARVLAVEIKEKLLYNFQDTASLPGVGAGLLVMVLSGVLLSSVAGAKSAIDKQELNKPFWKKRIYLVALAMILTGVLANEFVIEHVLSIKGGLDLSAIRSLRTIEKLLILGGTCILLGKWVAAGADWLLARAGIQLQSQEHADQVRVLVISLAIPWFILLVVAEAGKPERFWWLWPLQAIFVAAFITWILPRFRVPRPIVFTIALGTALLVVCNPLLLARVDAWRQTGWAGLDAPEVEVVNYVTAELEAEGRKQAAIGYHFFIYQFMAAYNITNSYYKVGSDFDLLFKYPKHITNTDRCAEGLAPTDEYRVVQTKPRGEGWAPRLYFDVPLDPSFTFVRQFGTYQIFRRQ